MNITGKKLLAAIAIIVLLGIFFWPSKVFKIRSVEDGNTIVLTNGATVKLLGVSPTTKSKEILESYKGQEVKLWPDHSSFFDERKLGKKSNVYAYVNLPKSGGVCINSRLLKEGASALVDNCPDSLKAYQSYVKGAPEPPSPEPVKPINYTLDDIVLPVYTPVAERRHNTWYSDGNYNVDMLEEACDYNLPYTKSFANQLAARSEGPYNIGQICEIYDYCRHKWRYVNDPADKEYVARASESIASSLTGDCDDFAVLLASCILAIGGHPCINCGANPQGAHAFTEVDIAGFDQNEVLSTIRKKFPDYNIESLNVRNDGSHKWLNLDWQTGYPGGRYYDCSTYRQAYPYYDGKFIYQRLN